MRNSESWVLGAATINARLESHHSNLQSHRNIDVKMAPGHLIVLLACFLLGSSATTCMRVNWPSEASSSLSHQSTSAESEKTFIQSSRKGQLLCDERLREADFREMDLDHPDHRGLQLHASKIHRIRDGCFHYHETDSKSHVFSHAVSLLEVSFGEADALLAFKDGIRNYSRGALDDWTPGKRSDYCSWTRVTCNRQLHVTALHLSSLDLTGSLGPSLCNLTYLEELHLGQNFLQSEIPPELGRLSRLRILNLEENSLYGSIPEELGNLTSLQILNLGSQGSGFNGTIREELGQLSELRFLNLGAVNNWYSEKLFYMTATNELRGTIPRSLGNCTKLWYLDFYGSVLTGVIPEELGKLIHLKYLSFATNNFTGAVPHQLGNLTTCESLSFRNNALQGHLPVGLANLSRLIVLDVGFNVFTGNLVDVSSTSWSELSWFSASRNSFTGPFPELLLSCRNLRTLYLNNNNFSGNLPEDLGRLSSARYIYIHSNMFRGELPKSFTNISFLTHLYLVNNNFTGPLNALRNSTLLKHMVLGSTSSVENLFTGHLTDEMVSSWPIMEKLDLGYNGLIGKIPTALGNLTQLRYLNLDSNKFDGRIPEELGCLKQLNYLYLSDNKLTGKIPASLANLQDIIAMDLGTNNLTGSIPRKLGNFTNIYLLGLSGNHLTGEIPPDLGNLTNIQYLFLTENHLTGEIPPDLGNLTNIYFLGLSFNHLTGEIPRDLGNLTNIQSLFLHENHLTGGIPPDLGKLQTLESLLLSYNNLTGSIPVTLNNCRALVTITLNHNSLGGQLTHINFTGLEYLTLFSISGNQFSGLFPVTLWNCYNLEWLDMSNNHLSGVLKLDVMNPHLHHPLVNLSALRVLSLASNYFSGSIPSSIWKLPALQVLDLSSNTFIGVLPRDLSGLVSFKIPVESKLKASSESYEKIEFNSIFLRRGQNTLEYTYVQTLALLDVSGNQLIGELPAELCTLQGLTHLYLDDNNFEGSIPAELGEIIDLLDLDLSKNQLSGPIPVSLSKLRLGYLNLSLNQLCGPIPVADSFDTRLSGSFLPGNPKLCGGSINKPCESSVFSCDGELDPGTVTTRKESSWSLYFHGVSITAFAIGASVGFATVIGLITLIPALRNRFLFPQHQTMYHTQSDYGLFRRPS